MIVRYDSLNRLEHPQMTLCNPGSVHNNDGSLTNIVGILTDYEAEELVANFNATSELNFRVNKIRRDDPDDNAYTYGLYNAIQNRRLVYLEDVGYFMITEVTDGYSDGISYKDVTAQSIDVEIQQKMIPYIEDGTYPLCTHNDSGGNAVKGILNRIVEVLPLWTIGNVDTHITGDANSECRWRTFEDVDTSLNCLGFLLENVQDAYECIVVFDIKNRIIDVYDQANYVRRTSVWISKEDFINSLEIKEDANDIYTAINVRGDDDITIAAVNPLGTSVIYNFDYYLDWMTSPSSDPSTYETLGDKVRQWQIDVEAAKVDNGTVHGYHSLNLEYYQLLDDKLELNAEKEKFGILLEMYRRCQENIVAEGMDCVTEYNETIAENYGTDYEINTEVSDIQALQEVIGGMITGRKTAIESIEADIVSKDTQLQAKKGAIDSIRNRLSIAPIIDPSTSAQTGGYFTPTEYDELSHYIFEGSYHDDYVVLTDNMSNEEQFKQIDLMYDRAQKQLEKVSKPTQQFDIDVEHFLFARDFSTWSSELETGCLINVELDDDDVAELFLSSITVNYDDHTLNMTFGNRYNKFDPKSLFEDLLGNITKSANTLNYIKDIIYPVKNGEFNAMRAALQTSRNLTMNSALASKNEEIIIDGTGYLGRKLVNDTVDEEHGRYDNKQIKIVGKNIVMTKDRWQNCSVAIGEIVLGTDDQGNPRTAYGVNAETIMGDIIVGSELRILNDQGNEIFTVLEDRVTSSVGELGKNVSQVSQTAYDLSINFDNLSVDSVTTTTGYKFDQDGLNISQSGSEMSNNLTNTGMYVKRSGTDILTANNEGVTALNLTAQQYLNIGTNSRFENYSKGNDTHRTACFYNET